MRHVVPIQVRNAYRNGRELTSRLMVERRHGIETAKRVGRGPLGLADPRLIPYEASPWLALRRGLARRRITPEDVFIDLGCGKGRVLILAARYPFRRVIGVERSAELVAIARANLARVQAARDRAEVICADAAASRLPDDVTVVYMYNPFRDEVFAQALELIIASLDRAPRRLTLLYRSPFEHVRVVGTGRFRLVRTHWGIVPGSLGSALRVYESV